MYDASLDQFYPHQWDKPSIWPTYYNSGSWNSNQNFVKVESYLKPAIYTESKYFEKQYDHIYS